MMPSSTLKLSGDIIEAASVETKQLDYIVVGDATTVDGLAAPYDEEETPYILKIERPDTGNNILDFWVKHANKDLYSVKNSEIGAFEVVG
ncbi:hypothetical protein [Tunturiibacter gelidoferens]|uniref:Uncharacterized protein n=1 Tax=Tunturiibacter gelidiferens TaxID=3069689 RepID=A0A9X0U443_9BACT|nr:hypothetical protein [Edaphobacter lichenicola]MBB5327487.1 hypothetical protein [Edaphobacter lichenicola]